MIHDSIQERFERLGLGLDNKLAKAILACCGSKTLTTTNILISIPVLLRNMDITLNNAITERCLKILRRDTSYFNAQVNKARITCCRDTSDLVYAFRFGGKDGYLLLIFEPVFAEYLLDYSSDDTGESVSSKTSVNLHEDLESEITRYYGHPISHLVNKGKPVNEGIWSIPFMGTDIPRDTILKNFIDHISQMRLKGNINKRPWLIGIWGLTGIGKSTLARMIYNSPSPDADYDFDNRFWITLGKTIRGDALIAKKNSLLKYLGEKDNDCTNNKSLAHLSETHPLFLVLDDVWHPAQVEPFLELNKDSCILLTSRNKTVLQSIGNLDYLRKLYPLSAADAHILVERLTGIPPFEYMPFYNEAVDRCSGIPLALRLIAAMAKYNPERWPIICTYFNKPRLKAIKGFLRKYDSPDSETSAGVTVLFDALSLSTYFLDDNYLPHFHKLAVLQEKANIPFRALQVLWNTDAGESKIIVDELAALDLVEVEENNSTLTLHDIKHAFVRNCVGTPGKLRKLHKGFLRNYATLCCPNGGKMFDGNATIPWHEGPTDDKYFFEWLAYHLAGAGMTGPLKRLLSDYHWMKTRIQTSDIYALINDYNYIGGNKTCRLIRDSLRLSSHILINDKKALASQITGRLVGTQEKSIVNFLENIQKYEKGFWLRPLSASLTKPDSPLIRTLCGHTSGVIVSWFSGKWTSARLV